MNRRTLLTAALLSSTGGALTIVACAETSDGDDSYVESNVATVSDAAADDVNAKEAADAADVDAGPCTDCAWYPADCAPEVACGSGPFDPSTVGGAIDGRSRIQSIRGRSASDVWAVGAQGAVAHFDGAVWTRIDISSTDALHAIWLHDDTQHLLTSLLRYHTPGVDDAGAPTWATIDFATFTDKPAPTTLSRPTYPLMFTSAWSAEGATWLWGTTLDTAKDPTSSTAPGLWRVHLSTAKQAGLEAVEGLPSGTCTTLPCRRMIDIHGFDANNLWAVGTLGATIRIIDADGATPQATAFNSRTVNELRGVWAASATEAWSVGAGGTIRHYAGDPARWDVVDDVPVASDLNAVWGTSSNDVWAVGDDAVVLHYDGSHWSRVPVAGLGLRRPKLTTVWTPSPGHVWIGGDGFVLSLGGKS